MNTFVLIPGAWLGAWVWGPVAQRLRGLGHRVHALTLSGLGGPVEGVGLATHVSDVLDLLRSQDLRDAVLVGHSYAGMVAGQVAGLAPDRVAHTVFVDANLPHDGLAMTDGWSPRGQELVRAAVEANGGWWPVPELEEFDGHGLSAEQVAWLVAGARPHPGRTLFDPARLARPLSGLSASYVTCLRPNAKPRDDVVALHGQPTWSFAELDTGHWPMVSQPEALTTLLLNAHHRPNGP